MRIVNRDFCFSYSVSKRKVTWKSAPVYRFSSHSDNDKYDSEININEIKYSN